MLGTEPRKLYHSSFGKTTDELMKPELIAHSIWIAAPILPGTAEEKEAKLLHQLLSLEELKLPAALAAGYGHTKLNDSVYGSNDVTFIKQCIVRRIQEAKYISPAYMHVDGTSFAAPIVSAVIAQLLEVKPELTPMDVRSILFSTAKRISDQAAERQGFGVIQPRKAIIRALGRESFAKPKSSPNINKKDNCIEFYLQHYGAYQVAVAGSFNNWAGDILLMEPGENGIWKIAIPLLPAGRHQYKFFVDEKTWIEDIDNPYKEPDGFFGFNSILIINT
jgi:serine protease AprX